MQAFEGGMFCILAISLWSGISAKIVPLPEEGMNVVSFLSFDNGCHVMLTFVSYQWSL